MTFFSLQLKGAHHKQLLGVLICVAFILLLLFFYLLDQTRHASLEGRQQDIPAAWPGQLTTATHERQSLYTPSMFIPSALEHNHFIPITAVILRTRQDQGIHHIVNYLHKYPFIKELYVYNLLPSHPLDTKEFEQPNRWLLHKVDISVIEGADQEQGVMALFTTCALATHGYCFIQDDRSLHLHMDTLYTQFMRYPELIHVNARSEEYITHRRWQLYHQEGQVDMHTGYANLRHGAIIPRQQAQRFLNQVAVVQTTWSNQSVDAYFALWSNSYPYILSNPLSLPAEHELPYHDMWNAFETLKSALADQLPYFVDQNNRDPPLEQRDVKTACANDKCVFVTNLDPFPLSTDMTTTNMTSADMTSTDMTLPDSEFWLHRGYHAAVDGDSGTCWNTYHIPKEGDYFGLDLIGNMRASRLLLDLRQPIFDSPFRIRGLNVHGWVDCPVTPIHTSPHRRLLFHMQCADGLPISAIRFFFAHTHQRSFDLCGLGLDNFII